MLRQVTKTLDCLKPLYLHTREKKQAKRARRTRGWGGGGASEASKKNRETVYVTGKSGLIWRSVLSRFYPHVQRSNKNTNKQRTVQSTTTLMEFLMGFYHLPQIANFEFPEF